MEAEGAFVKCRAPCCWRGQQRQGEDVPWALSGQNQTCGPLAECLFLCSPLQTHRKSWSDHQTPLLALPPSQEYILRDLSVPRMRGYGRHLTQWGECLQPLTHGLCIYASLCGSCPPSHPALMPFPEWTHLWQLLLQSWP